MPLSFNNRIASSDADFEANLARLTANAEYDESVAATVSAIIVRIRSDGDPALLEYTRQFDNFQANDVAELTVGRTHIDEALRTVPERTLEALRIAARRIRDCAEKQKLHDWEFADADANLVGQKVMPLDSVGVYVPGGKAVYPSSLLMTAIPAKVAGVPRVVAVTPISDGKINPLILAAASLCEVDELYTIGGAQAVAALAYGTEAVRPVDKIVGPGNQYVTEAKRQVFGKVGIDMLAGPSEIVVVCDQSNDPEWIAADLFSQAEHDEQARAILISADAGMLDAVTEAMQKLIQSMPRAAIIERSISEQGAFIQVRDLAEAADVVNRLAPEHLMLALDDADQLLSQIRHAGAIFLGKYSPEVFGDYCAGPDHVLPTATTARFASPLGVYDFQKRSSIIRCSQAGADKLADVAGHLAECEGLFAHADSAYRRKTKSS